MRQRMYFIGVTTGASAIHHLFPKWAAQAGPAGAELTGIDIAIDGAPEDYRAAMSRIHSDPEARGALITTHKVQIYEYARYFFTDFDTDAASLGEVNCIVRQDSRMTGMALDTLTANLALPPFHGTALILGAGGAALALATALQRNHRP